MDETPLDLLKVCRSSCCSAEVMMKDGTIRPAAVKRVWYDSSEEQLRANAELAALRDAEGCPHLGQCLGVYPLRTRDPNWQHLFIVLE